MVDPVEQESNVVPLRAQEEPKRTPNPVWDACVEVLGYEPRTDTEKRLWGKMTTSLRRAGATEEEIRDVAEFYRKKWPDIDFTITALEKWFSHFLRLRDKRVAAKARQICPECDMAAPNHTSYCGHAQS